MRLIDADELRKSLDESHSVALEWYDNEQDDEEIIRSTQSAVTYADAIFKVDHMPTIDAVQVVRCKDCKKYEPIFEGFIGRCELCGLMREIDYCSFGERGDEK